MYGVVAGQKSDSKTKEVKEQVENKELKRRTFKEKIVRYFKSKQESNVEYKSGVPPGDIFKAQNIKYYKNGNDLAKSVECDIVGNLK